VTTAGSAYGGVPVGVAGGAEPVITEIPQLISCFISKKSENTSDHAAAPLR
jgi:hypothetical protein